LHKLIANPDHGGKYVPFVLKNLIACFLCSTAYNVPRSCSLECRRIFANIVPPHILDATRTSTVHAFGLVLPNNHVPQRRTLLENKYGAIFISLGLSLASTAATRAIKQSHLAIKDTTSWDQTSSRKRRGAGRRGPYRGD
jgi:hypothetical protein